MGEMTLKIYSFKKDVGKHVTTFASNFVMSPIIVTDSGAHIECMYLEEGGIIGYHKAAVPQLLLRMEGSGKARGANNEYIPVANRDVCSWEKGEYHEVVLRHGLTAIVMESECLQPGAFMDEQVEKR